MDLKNNKGHGGPVDTGPPTNHMEKKHIRELKLTPLALASIETSNAIHAYRNGENKPLIDLIADLSKEIKLLSECKGTLLAIIEELSTRSYLRELLRKELSQSEPLPAETISDSELVKQFIKMIEFGIYIPVDPLNTRRNNT